MAAKTLSTLITEVRKEIQEPIQVTPPSGTNTGQWDDTEISGWLGDANQDLTEMAEIESPTAYQFTTVAGTESYSMPSDFLRVRRVEAQDQAQSTLWAPLYQGSIDMRLPNTVAGAITGRGRPAAYFWWGGLLYLIPIPDAVYTINVFYYRRAPDMVLAADTPIIDQRFHQILREYAVARALQKIGEPGYITYDALYNAHARDMVAKLEEERRTEGPQVVRDI